MRFNVLALLQGATKRCETIGSAMIEDTYIVALRADGAGPPTAIRLRKWLKEALRTHGLRCTSISPAKPSLPNGTEIIRRASEVRA